MTPAPWHRFQVWLTAVVAVAFLVTVVSWAFGGPLYVVFASGSSLIVASVASWCSR